VSALTTSFVISPTRKPRGSPPVGAEGLATLVDLLCAAGNRVLHDSEEHGFVRTEHGVMCFLESPIDERAWAGQNLDTLGVRFNRPNDTLLQGRFVVWGGTHRAYAETVRPYSGPPPDTMQYDVDVFRGGQRFHGRITVQLLPNRDVRVALDGPSGRIEEIKHDAFEALRAVRRILDPTGWRVAVMGARRDATSSGMQRDQMRGLAVYLLVVPRGSELPSVRTFDPAPPETVGTVEEQDAYFAKWGQA
jgi:hypothetical protein